MHLVYIVKATLIERDLVRYGITEILAAGHRVSVLDISEFCHPELQHDHSKTANASGMDVHYISTESDIADKFHIMASADCAMLLIHSISCNWKSYQVLRHIQKAELPYLILKPMLFPGWNVRTDRSVSTSWISEFAKRFRTIKIQILPAYPQGIYVSQRPHLPFIRAPKTTRSKTNLQTPTQKSFMLIVLTLRRYRGLHRHPSKNKPCLSISIYRFIPTL